MSRLVYHYYLWFVAAILFTPKIDIVKLPGFPSIKIEDIIGLIILILVLVNFKVYKKFIKTPLFVLLLLCLCYIFIFPSSILVFFRWFVAFSVVHYCLVERLSLANLRRMLEYGVYILSCLAVLQKFMPIPFVHTGEILIGPALRPSGLGSNAVEFSLIIYFSCLILVAMKVSGLRLYFILIFAFVAIVLSETRVITVAQGLLLTAMLISRHRFLGLLGALSLIVFGSFVILNGDIRLNALWNLGLFRELIDILTLFEPKTYLGSIAHYCFYFNDELVSDQSLAMRLSKTIFVVNHVVLGTHWMGFGFENCIGGAADNQLIRLLNDFGMMGGVVGVIFLGWFFLMCKQGLNLTMTISVFLGFFLCFLFYDVLYFSRSLPLLSILIFILKSGRLHGKN